MSDGNQSPSKSDTANGGNDRSATPKKDAPKFTEREEAVMKLAWSCLKSGPPEVDFEKLRVAGGFNTVKTAQNTWGTIKKKLLAITPENANTAGSGNGDEGAATPKPKATPKKRGKKTEDGEGEATDSPAKKARTPAKKGKVKSGAKVKEEEKEDGDDEEMA